MKGPSGSAGVGCRGTRGRRLVVGAGLVLMLAAGSWATRAAGRERVSFDADWRFAKGDPNGVGDELRYANMREWVLASGVAFTKDPNFAHRQRPEGNPGGAVAYTQPEFDDGGWRRVTLPHDWGIEGPFDPKAPGGTGKLPFSGVGWYRKHFAGADGNNHLEGPIRGPRRSSGHSPQRG